MFSSCLPIVGGSPGTPSFSTTKTGCHDIAEILLKVALSTNNQNHARKYLRLRVLKIKKRQRTVEVIRNQESMATMSIQDTGPRVKSKNQINKQTQMKKDEQHGFHQKSGFLNIINISFS